MFVTRCTDIVTLTGLKSGMPSWMLRRAISDFNFFLWPGLEIPMAVRSCKYTIIQVLVTCTMTFVWSIELSLIMMSRLPPIPTFHRK